MSHRFLTQFSWNSYLQSSSTLHPVIFHCWRGKKVAVTMACRNHSIGMFHCSWGTSLCTSITFIMLPNLFLWSFYLFTPLLASMFSAGAMVANSSSVSDTTTGFNVCTWHCVSYLHKSVADYLVSHFFNLFRLMWYFTIILQGKENEI